MAEVLQKSPQNRPMSKQDATSSSPFSFSKDAPEFVPGGFKFNASAAEFKPSPTLGPQAPPAVVTSPKQGPASPMQGPMSPMGGMMQQVAVVGPAGAFVDASSVGGFGVYPVMAVQIVPHPGMPGPQPGPQLVPPPLSAKENKPLAASTTPSAQNKEPKETSPKKEEPTTPAEKEGKEGEGKPKGPPTWAERLKASKASAPSPVAAKASTPSKRSAQPLMPPSPSQGGDQEAAAKEDLPKTEDKATAADKEEAELQDAEKETSASCAPDAEKATADTASSDHGENDNTDEAMKYENDDKPTASHKLASELSKNDDIIRYRVDELKAMSELPDSNGHCPASVPQFLRKDEVLEEDKKRSNGSLRYSVARLRELAEAPQSQGSCPPSIPQYLRASPDEGDESPKGGLARRRYKIEFLMQFENKATCMELPNDHKIPKDLIASSSGSRQPEDKENEEEDSWRAGPRRTFNDPKKSKGSRTPGGKDITRAAPAKLETSATSWAAQQKAKQAVDDVNRKTKSILNKLTVEKFDSLFQQLLEAGISTEDHVDNLMREVFDKATTQHHFIEMYTRLCVKLNESLPGLGVKDLKGDEVSFKRILLNQCQDSFEKYLKEPNLDAIPSEDRDEARIKYKTKMLGNMKFVGQLLIHKVLSSKVIQTCTMELLQQRTEETLETLCAFLTTIGPIYDDKTVRYWAILQDTFKQCEELCKDKKVPARLRFLIKDVLELRAKNWERKVKANEPDGPMKISDVKDQWAKDCNVQDKRIQGGRSTPSASQSGLMSQDWENVARRGQQPVRRS
eukprot:TRINITY_DN80857_c0_g1_i1.p1 TRINITY_DN80857_c0_g1~~TRINITY_DN80857_c0_g1_i1.p1  ORF type:complete len:815 (-),score=221.71 TRINITY_DN80857_c0_g1_i1:186-2570(-)